MDMETEELLRRTLALAEENNSILRSMRSQARFARYFYILKLLFFVALAYGAYYYAMPYLDELKKVYQGLTEGVNIMFRNSMLK